jgi:deoxycytidine triphosphate deaminase
MLLIVVVNIEISYFCMHRGTAYYLETEENVTLDVDYGAIFFGILTYVRFFLEI